jgi:hypothetical protein
MLIGTLDDMTNAMSVCQHHDAVAGTSKQAVAYDYARRLANGYNKASPNFNRMIKYAVRDATGESLDFYQCALHNVSQCFNMYDSDVLHLAVYNPTY